MIHEVSFGGTIIIGDPCNMVKSEEDWYATEFGADFSPLGINRFLSFEMEEDCPAVVGENGQILGRFCTDSCMITAMYLSDLLTYNPGFDDHIAYEGNYTVIENFKGVLTVEETDEGAVLVGKGNIPFRMQYEDEEDETEE